MRYLPRMSSVEAVQFDGENVDEIRAACRLVDAAFKAPDGVSPNRKLAIWNAKRGTWDYCAVDDWVVVSEGWARVMKSETFVKEFVAESQVAR
jgi:hypothetical protein